MPKTTLAKSRAPSPATRGLNPNSLAFAQARAEFAWHLLDRPVVALDASFSRRSSATTDQAPRTFAPPVGKQCDFAVGEHLNFSDDSISPTMLSPSTASRAQ
jgi:hypothetical protein